MSSDASHEHAPATPAWINNPPSTKIQADASAAARGELLKQKWKQSAAFRARVGKNLKDVGSKAAPVMGKVGNQLQKVNLARLIDEMEHDQELADKLEFINNETKEENARKDLVREATEACQKEIEDHLENFLEEYPDATYEEWIKELHPDNIEQGMLLEGTDFAVVDARFYVEESDHRLMWNRHEKVPEGRHVVARSLKNTPSNSVDFLDDPSETVQSTCGGCDFMPNFTSGSESWGAEEADKPNDGDLLE